MVDYFYKRFQDKYNQDLQKILDSSENYTPEAIKAAEIILKERQEENIILKKSYTQEVKKKHSTGDNHFSTRPFFRTLSYRDFLTYFIIAFFWLAIHSIFDFYRDEPFIGTNGKTIKIVIFILLVFSLHIIYRIEHNRSNNFFGRVLTDIIFLFIVYLIFNIQDFLKDTQSFEVSDIFSVLKFILFGFICAFLFESGVALIKFLLRKIKCEIF